MNPDDLDGNSTSWMLLWTLWWQIKSRSSCSVLNRSNASYRLKHRVNLQDIWLYGFEDNLSDVEERGDVDLRVTIILAWALTFCWVFFW